MEATPIRISHLKGRELALEKEWGVDDAEWIAIVCLHSGAFTRGQYQAYFETGRNRGRRLWSGLTPTNSLPKN